MTIVQSLDPVRWNAYVLAHPKGSIFHTPEMVEAFRGTRHHHPFVLAALDTAGSMLALLVAVRVQTLPTPFAAVSSRSVLYSEPICREDDLGVQALTQLLLVHDLRMKDKVLFTEIRPLRDATRETSAFFAAHYEHSDYLNFLIDLRRPRDELWRCLTKQCRYDIRQGPQKGLTIRDVTSAEGVDTLYALLQRTYQRARVPLADKTLFTESLRMLSAKQMLKLFVAYHAGFAVGASALLVYKKVAYDWYCGTDRVKGVFVADSLTWHMIEWAHQQGCDLFDFGGAGRPDTPYGVRNFKHKFGGQLVNYGRYQKVYAHWKLALAERAYRMMRNSLGSHIWRAASAL